MACRRERPAKSPRFRVADDTVAELSQTYLGNILYALERCALSLDEEDKRVDAAFYRGIGRKLAEAHGRAQRSAGHAP